jgi:ectoine hydroxylase-related dioxygenase (phytanoyl-CoA dioxygenase family)
MYFNSNDFINLKKFFNENGFVVINNFFKKKQILDIKKKINRNKINFDPKHTYYEKIKNNFRYRRIESITDQSKDIQDILYSEKISNILQLLKKEKQVLFKDKLNFKYPGGEGFLPHIDGHFYWKDKNNKIKKGWSVYSDSFTNVVIPLEKSDEKNGCLYLSSKQDTLKLGDSWNKISKLITKFTPYLKKRLIKNFSFFPTKLNSGDVLIFDWYCAHLSKKNNSKSSRMIFYATFCKKNKKSNAVRNNYYSDKKLSKNNNLAKSVQ